ncbi:hypothetical protein C0J08_03535 [Marinomonas sp. CT5]|uniref:DUF2971 domain-containing protein n=1 Tax=Marinomonas sp. CT5 TaxID=2066133 RepID=UPI001BAE9868|nr:DUF2971 domain-containing protein [Marinomonas sp. CT5]QUX94540.1 hypothetical protein C0J08_03535 [Marinomonas sp. CT5]
MFFKFYPEGSDKYIFNEEGYVSLRFTQPDSLNDIFEIDPIFNHRGEINEIIEAVIKIHKTIRANETVDLYDSDQYIYPITRNDSPEEIAKKMYEERNKRYIDGYKRDMNKTYGILSLTDDVKNTLMWSKYSSEHSGYAIEIPFPLVEKLNIDKIERDFGVKLDNDKNGFYIDLKPEPVIYSTDRPIIDEGGLDTSFMYVKDDRWSAEREHRIACPLYAFENTRKKIKKVTIYTNIDCLPNN